MKLADEGRDNSFGPEDAMSHYYETPLFNEIDLAFIMRIAGQDFQRLVGYFGDDGARGITAIEAAHASGDAVALVDPAHKLKSEARQLGARRLGDIAAEIERTARRCIEQQVQPGTIDQEIALLRVCFAQTLAILCEQAPRRPSKPARAALAHTTPAGRMRLFGRRAAP